MRVYKQKKKQKAQLSNFKFYWIFFLLNFSKYTYHFHIKYYSNFKKVLENSKNFSDFLLFSKKKGLVFRGFKQSFSELIRIKKIIGNANKLNIEKLLHVFNFIFLCGLPSFFFKKITLRNVTAISSSLVRNKSFLFYGIGIFYKIHQRYRSYTYIIRNSFVGRYSDRVYRFFFFLNIYFYKNFKDNFLIKKFSKLSVVWWSVKKNFFAAITTIDNLDDYYMQLDFLGFWSTGIFLALFKLPKSVKHRVFFKILIVKHVRRTLLILNFFRFMFNFKNYVFDFKVLWNVFNSPLQEVFVNPDSKEVIVDLKISNLSNFDSQMLVFKDKVLEFNEYSNLRLRDIAWNKFLVRYKHLLKFNKVGGRPSYMRYMFKCDMIIVLRKETFTIQKKKKAKSLKKRMTKRIVKEAKRRHWVF